MDFNKKIGPRGRKTLIALGLAAALFAASPNAFATIIDDVFSYVVQILSKVNSINTKVTNLGTNVTSVATQTAEVVENSALLVQQTIEGKGLVAAENIQQAISEAVTMMQQTLPSPEELSEFEVSGCQVFKDDLVLLNDSLFYLADTLANMPQVGFTMSIQEPGLSDLIPSIPCNMLFPASKVTQRLGMDTGKLADMFVSVSSDLGLLNSVIRPPTANPSIHNLASYQTSLENSASAASIQLSGVADSCTILRENAEPINYALIYVNSVGLLTKVVGALLMASGETVLAGPSEADVGAWGFAGVTVKSNPLKSFGEFFAGAATVISSVGDSVSTTRTFCGLTDAHDALQTQLTNQQAEFDQLILEHDALLTQMTSLTSNYVDLGAEFATLQANHQALLDGQLEILNILNKVKNK